MMEEDYDYYDGPFCRYCGAPIEFKQSPCGYVPINYDNTPHECRNELGKAPTVDEIIKKLERLRK